MDFFVRKLQGETGADSGGPKYEFCHQMNISSCLASEKMSDFILSVYNPLARSVEGSYIRIPVSSPAWNIEGPDGTFHHIAFSFIPVVKKCFLFLLAFSSSKNDLKTLIQCGKIVNFYVTDV